MSCESISSLSTISRKGEENTLNLDSTSSFLTSESQEFLIPNLIQDEATAKAYLQKICPTEGISLYDHLNSILTKLLSERPDNALEYFEEYSRKIKETRVRVSTDYLKDDYIPPENTESATKLLPLFQFVGPKKPDSAPDEDILTDASTTFPNIMENLFYFEQVGVALPKHEMFCIALSIRKLSQSQPIRKVRFWGKILGTKKDYFLAEAEMEEEEYSKRIEMIAQEKEIKEKELQEERDKEMEHPIQEEEKEQEKAEEEQTANDEKETKDEPVKHKPLPPLPKAEEIPVIEIPSENPGEGVNKKVYYVCNEPGEEWTMLPDVTPKQIVVARQIKRYFTGDLDTELLTDPPYPGKEINYLRAQIARISAGTQVSPSGLYKFSLGEEEEEEEEEDEVIEERSTYTEDPDYEPLPLWQLLDTTFSNWVHHIPHILQQGRTKWWNPKKASDEHMEDEEEEDEEERDEEEDFEGLEAPEVGPRLLTPLSEDASLEDVPPWSARISSQVMPDFAVAGIMSNLWPGAYAFAAGRKSDNIYIGWGHKYVSHNHFPPPMEAVQDEYPLGPEIMETEDPTVEEEEEWRKAREVKKTVQDEELDEEIEDEETEEEGYDEYDDEYDDEYEDEN